MAMFNSFLYVYQRVNCLKRYSSLAQTESTPQRRKHGSPQVKWPSKHWWLWRNETISQFSGKHDQSISISLSLSISISINININIIININIMNKINIKININHPCSTISIQFYSPWLTEFTILPRRFLNFTIGKSLAMTDSANIFGYHYHIYIYIYYIYILLYHYIYIYDYIWLYMTIYDYIWLYMAIYVYDTYE